jgi:hypothetical protein
MKPSLAMVAMLVVGPGVLAPLPPAGATVGGAATREGSSVNAPATVGNASGGGCTTRAWGRSRLPRST